MKTKHILILLLLLPVVAAAQENYFFVAWNGTLPLSSTEFIENGSGRGAKVGFRKFVGMERRFSVGADFNWAQYDEY